MSIVNPGSGLTLNGGNRHQRSTAVGPPFPLPPGDTGPKMKGEAFGSKTMGVGPSERVSRRDLFCILLL